MSVAEPPAQLCTQLQGRVPWPGCVDVMRGTLWRCQPGHKVGALFSGELAALRGGDVTAQPVDQQDPGVNTAGPAGTADAPLPPVSLQATRSGMTCQGRDSPELSGDALHAGRLWGSLPVRGRKEEGAGQGALWQPEPGLCPDAQNQETQRESAAGRRPQWRKKPEPPLGAEVCGGPGAGAAVPGERGPVGAHTSTAGLGSAQHGGTGEKGVSLPHPGNPLVLTAFGPAGVRSQPQASSCASHLSRPRSALDPGGRWLASSPQPCGCRRAPRLVWLRALRVCTASPPCPHGSSSSGAVGWHRCLRAPLLAPPPSLHCLPGWRSRADPSQALPCSPSRPACCPGQAVLCALPTLRKRLINSFTLRCDQ